MSKDTHNKYPHGDQPGKPSERHGSKPDELAAINDTLKAFAEKYNKNNKTNPRRESWKFGLEVAAVIGVGLYTLLTGGLLIVGALQTSRGGEQVKASQDQLKIMEDTEHRQLRAYVGVIPGDIEDFGVVGKQRFHFVRKNYGLSPAYDVGFSTVVSKIIKIGQTIPEVPGSGSTCVNPGAAPSIAGLSTMFPSAEFPLTIIDPKKLESDEVQSVRAGLAQIVYLGDICYHDAFGASHYTNYCWMYKGSSMTAKDADGCLTHNDSN